MWTQQGYAVSPAGYEKSLFSELRDILRNQLRPKSYATARQFVFAKKIDENDSVKIRVQGKDAFYV